MAGEATAAAAAPVAETFKKSRRFIQASPCSGVFPDFLEHGPAAARFMWHPGRSGRRSLTRKFGRGIREAGMTPLTKRKSHIAGTRVRPQRYRPGADSG